MSARILDSSVLMAILLGELGQERASALAEGGLMSSVNLAEVMTKCIEFAFSEDVALSYFHASNITVLDFNHTLAVAAGELQRKAPRGVLSLGDRACIATALHHQGTAVTADRIWSTLDLGCPVELIR
ncbi:PIN domain-containing protein [Phyllobacterium zundukense]|uniref:PIN domain-containing protein n=1 Tax=Phyllobacterium zundukense TaxID=1867719 RepID=A0A2N9VQW5_9HYPH|nr:type II toxin-antitoxin system VapC family toxin [Phyllobacterium zundukense]PIO41883.1 hypothetical protein B5P45_22685 [Phyllobacterium zundukense]